MEKINTKVKGYRVTDAHRKYKVGIAARSLEDLELKTRTKFQNITEGVPSLPKKITFCLGDGTKIDSEEYFLTLPAQTTLVWIEEGKIADTDADRLYKTIREVNIEYLTAGEQIEEFILNEMKMKINKLSGILNSLDGSQVSLSTRLEHPEWFQGLDSRSKTKEEYLFRRAQDRIRTYYYKTREDLFKESTVQFTYVLNFLHEELRKVQFFGCYFDRSRYTVGDNELTCLCDDKGTFVCQGLWNKDFCLYEPKHKINPYISRESRILFQIWNLDHRVERSRFIVPAIKKAYSARINLDQLFRDLFTIDNLKLVHIVCHDKGAHTTATSNYTVDDNCEKKRNGLKLK